MAKSKPQITVKTHEQYTIAEGAFVLIASIDLTQANPRITLTKPDSFGSNAKARDYHFELSHIDAVEGFAKCALKAVQVAKKVAQENGVRNPNKAKK